MRVFYGCEGVEEMNHLTSENQTLVMVNPENFWKWMELQEEINRDIAGELEALRDEIKKLKEQPHFHHESYCRKCHEVVTNNV